MKFTAYSLGKKPYIFHFNYIPIDNLQDNDNKNKNDNKDDKQKEKNIGIITINN